MADGRNEEEYFIPLTDQRVFGAGIKRKRIAFVPATTQDRPGNESSSLHTNTTTTLSPGDRYLAIAMKNSPSQSLVPTTATISAAETENVSTSDQRPELVCSVCKQVISSNQDSAATNAHESSIAHQVCLPHSHPPSHLDRDHVGLKYLSGYGWDPDARTGLGARGEGIRAPVKAKEKRDTAGLGVRIDDDDNESTRVTKRKTTSLKEEKIVKVNAKEVRKLESEKKKRAEKLRQSFYAEDYTMYLGSER